MSTALLTRPRAATDSDDRAVSPDTFTGQKLIGRVSARAMFDEEFKRDLVANPARVLVAEGMSLPADLAIRVVGSFDEVPDDHPASVMYLVIPDAGEMSEEDLTMAPMAAQSCQSTASTACTTPSCVSSASTASTNSCS